MMKPLATSKEVLEDVAWSDDDVIENELNLCIRPAPAAFHFGPQNWL